MFEKRLSKTEWETTKESAERFNWRKKNKLKKLLKQKKHWIEKKDNIIGEKKVKWIKLKCIFYMLHNIFNNKALLVRFLVVMWPIMRYSLENAFVSVR